MAVLPNMTFLKMKKSKQPTWQKGRIMERITKKEFDKIPAAYKGVFADYHGEHPEWKGRRTAFLPGHGTTLFIEGVSFEIVDKE